MKISTRVMYVRCVSYAIVVFIGIFLLCIFFSPQKRTIAPVSAAPMPTAVPVVSPTATSAVVLKGIQLHVSVVDTEATRQLGLGGRAGLAPDEGMLFVFPVDGVYGFWMKDMRFSIDIVWFSADKQVIYIARSVSPDTYPQSFGPNSPSRYVLELPAGWAAAHNLAIGDVAQF